MCKTRDEKIDALIARGIENADNAALEDVLRYGCKGYEDMDNANINEWYDTIIGEA